MHACVEINTWLDSQINDMEQECICIYTYQNLICVGVDNITHADKHYMYNNYYNPSSCRSLLASWCQI